MKQLKQKLDAFVQKYETPEFIKKDPVQFLHNYNKKQDIEIVGLISSAFAYGRRDAFIEKLKIIHSFLGENPYNTCVNLDKKLLKENFCDFKYRFNTGDDVQNLLCVLHRFYNEYSSMEDYLNEKIPNEEIQPKEAITSLSQMLCEGVSSKSYSYLFPNPVTKSACKRFNLFLKWMVRKSLVDIGVWECIKPKDLIIPLDVHVAKISRSLGLTERKQNDWKTAEDITAKLRLLDCNDPIKYDFALFGIGVEKENI